MQLLEQRCRTSMGRLAREHTLERVQCAVDVSELLADELRVSGQSGAPFVAVGEKIDFALHRGRRLVHHAGLGLQLGETRPHRAVTGRDCGERSAGSTAAAAGSFMRFTKMSASCM